MLVGHESLIYPANDAERQFDVFAALLGALVFGYVVGEIGTLVAHLDRQVASWSRLVPSNHRLVVRF